MTPSHLLNRVLSRDIGGLQAARDPRRLVAVAALLALLARTAEAAERQSQSRPLARRLW